MAKRKGKGRSEVFCFLEPRQKTIMAAGVNFF